MRRVLIAQNDLDSGHQIASLLKEEGFEVALALEGEGARRLVQNEEWDLVILDVVLPGTSGLDLCQYIREHTTTPVIIFTKMGQDEMIAQALNLGADDYLVKPVNLRVFLAHLYAVLRRAGRAAEQFTGVLRRGNLVVDLDEKMVTVRGQRVNLSPSEFKLLASLALNPGRVLSSRSLMRELTGYTGTEQEAQRLIKVHVHNLRRKIEEEPENPHYIQNVHGFGYKFERRAKPERENFNQFLT